MRASVSVDARKLPVTNPVADPPSVLLQGSFFTPLKLVDAFLEYDEFFALSRRKYVPPNFAEMRHVLNIAQVDC